MHMYMYVLCKLAMFVPVVDGVGRTVLIHHKHFVQTWENTLVIGNGKRLPIRSDSQPACRDVHAWHAHVHSHACIGVHVMSHFSSLMTCLDEI